jgi:hypothetical protein
VIIFACENLSIRAELVSFLLNLNKSKSLEVLNAGGSFGDSFTDVTTALIDLNLPLSKDSKLRNFYQGDINLQSTWDKIPDKFFDFSICTHTLEDIRDPGFVINNLIRSSRAGFITVPNKYSEMSNIESMFWLGYSHHRWIFNFIDNKFIAMAKFPPFSAQPTKPDYLIFYFFKIIKKLSNRVLPKKRLGYLPIRIKHNNPNFVLQPGKISHNIELSIIWINDLDFEYANNDFSGINQENLIQIGSTFINAKFDQRLQNLPMALEKLKKCLLEQIK